MHLNMKNCV